MIPGINTGGGGLSADFGATASNQGGSAGGQTFGNYYGQPQKTQAQALMPWIVGGVVVLGALIVFSRRG